MAKRSLDVAPTKGEAPCRKVRIAKADLEAGIAVFRQCDPTLSKKAAEVAVRAQIQQLVEEGRGPRIHTANHDVAPAAKPKGRIALSGNGETSQAKAAATVAPSAKTQATDAAAKETHAPYIKELLRKDLARAEDICLSAGPGEMQSLSRKSMRRSLPEEHRSVELSTPMECSLEEVEKAVRNPALAAALAHIRFECPSILSMRVPSHPLDLGCFAPEQMRNLASMISRVFQAVGHGLRAAVALEAEGVPPVVAKRLSHVDEALAQRIQNHTSEGPSGQDAGSADAEDKQGATKGIHHGRLRNGGSSAFDEIPLGGSAVLLSEDACGLCSQSFSPLELATAAQDTCPMTPPRGGRLCDREVLVAPPEPRGRFFGKSPASQSPQRAHASANPSIVVASEETGAAASAGADIAMQPSGSASAIAPPVGLAASACAPAAVLDESDCALLRDEPGGVAASLTQTRDSTKDVVTKSAGSEEPRALARPLARNPSSPLMLRSPSVATTPDVLSAEALLDELMDGASVSATAGLGLDRLPDLEDSRSNCMACLLHVCVSSWTERNLQWLAPSVFF